MYARMVNRMNTDFKGLVLWYHGHNIDQKDNVILTKYVTKLSMAIANPNTKKKKIIISVLVFVVACM